MMTSGGIHHVEINVSDLSRSSEFWGWLLASLGFSPYEDWGEGGSWRLAVTYLVHVQTEARFATPPYHRRTTGVDHLAFHASSPRHVDELAFALRRRGAPLLYEERLLNDDRYAVYCEDPDRIKAEVVAPS